MSVKTRMRNARVNSIRSPLVDIGSRQNLERRRLNNVVEKVVRKAALTTFKKGTHPQMWRVSQVTGVRQKVEGLGAILGPMGALGDDIIFEMTLNTGLLYQLQTLKIKINSDILGSLIKTKLINPTISYLKSKIDIWVPTKTDKLRNSLRNSLDQSNITSFPYKLWLNTKTVEYGGPVNKMPTGWLRRSGAAPQARKGWYGFLLVNGRNKSKKLFKEVVRSVAKLIPKPLVKKYFPKRTSYNLARALFGFSHR